MNSLFSFSTTPYCTYGETKWFQLKINTISFKINGIAYQDSKIWTNFPQDVKYAARLITCKQSIVN